MSNYGSDEDLDHAGEDDVSQHLVSVVLFDVLLEIVSRVKQKQDLFLFHLSERDM